VGDPVIAAAGDIACDPLNSNFNGGHGSSNSCHQMSVSDLLVNAGLAAVLDLGDNQYYCGGLAAYQQSYDPSWGRVKNITYPAVGNHEYITSPGSGGSTGCNTSNAGAQGHFAYFGASAGDPSKGYYSFDIGTWHLIMLNSNCGSAGGCSASTAQGQWLRADLAAHTNFCTLAYWHVPVFSSGGRASTTYRTFWDALYAADADVVLAGHDHIYERFAPQTPTGARDLSRGIREFVVGTGGANHTSIPSVKPNSEVRNSDTYGVLKLTLHPTNYDWQFVPEAGGTFTDSGTGQCHGIQSDTQPPSAPTALNATATSPGSVALSWGASIDNVAVSGYRVFRNGTQIATVSGTSYVDDQATPATSYTYTVAAYDAGGNQSALSGSVTLTTPPDVDPPTTPTGLNATAVAAERVDLSWTSSTDDVRVQGYDILRDDAVVGTAPATAGTTATYADVGVQPETPYTYRVRAYDAAGNRSTVSAPITVTTPARPTVLTFSLSDDSYVRSDQATTNFGSATSLQVDGSPAKRILMRFTVSGVGARPVTGATMRLHVTNASPIGGALHRVTGGAWTEGGVTWNNQPAFATAVLTSLGPVSVGGWYDLDLGALVTGDGVYEVVLDSTSSDGADYDSSEGSASLAPQVMVTTTG
jgi:chitodextrinase